MLTEIEILSLSADELEAEVQKHNALYWDQHQPEIPDTLYDLLVEQLRQLRPASPILEELGESKAEEGLQVLHDVPMLSLEKCYSEEELLRWFERFEGNAVVTPKVDGVAMSVQYDASGQLRVGATRGDGRKGERITENARRIVGVPESIAIGPLEVRGEAYMPLDVFREKWAEHFANPRNLTAGALKLKDAERTAGYEIHFFAYEAIGLETLPTEEQRFARLKELGFEPVPFTIAEKSGGQQAFETLERDRAQLNYETDGVVFRVNDSSQHEAMGRTAHHPRFAIAYKFQGESGFSYLRAVEWSVSRTGKINPVAIIDAVSLSGVTVRRVSLHNLGIMELLSGEGPLTLNAKVLVTRRGGVIPHIESVVDAGDVPVVIPEVCPSCGAPTRREEDFLVATHDPQCVTTALKRLEHFSAVADIKGLGPKVLQQLFDAELVREPADIYLLSKEELMGLERSGEKTADNLLAAIEERRQLELSTLLTALGIKDLGAQVARSLQAHLGSWQAIRDARVEELTAIEGIGEKIAVSIVVGLRELSEVIEHLRTQVEILVSEEDSQLGDGKLAGVAIVFTGAMATLKRKEAQDLVRELGGTTPASITKNVRFLVIGDLDHEKFTQGNYSSKAKAALKLQEEGSEIEVISETAFLAMIGEENAQSIG